jgi:hypothetical protein
MDKDHDGKITEKEYSQYMKEINDNQFRKPTGCVARHFAWLPSL